MTRLKPLPFALILLLCVFVVLSTAPFAVQLISAQDTQCGTVEAVDYPVDPTVFQIAQRFGAPSPRHNGRYHTGDDWFGGADSMGQPVYAIARGRVSYSSPNAWGRDGGVVIIEHEMPDGTTFYSMYGHMMERSDITFPARFTCVEMGTIVGAVGDIRPAPHVHIEVRTSGPDIAGVGYEWEDPRVLGYRDPNAFITDWQAWFGEASLWHVEFADAPIAPPLVLDDYSLITLNGVFMRRVLPDGRILWRVTLEEPAVAVVGYEGAPLLIFADGTMQRVDYEGNFGESWRVDTPLDSPPIDIGEAHIFHTPDNALVAIDRRWRDVLWRLDDVPPYVRSYAAGNLFTLLTDDYTLLTISADGRLVNSAALRETASFAAAGGDLLAYTRGGFWQIGGDGTWALKLAEAPQSTTARALAADGAMSYLFDGATLYAYRDGQSLWVAALTGVTGTATLRVVDTALLLISTGGSVAAFAAEDGTVCGSLRMWGDSDDALMWHDAGDDGVLRVMIGRRLVGLDWQGFGGC